LKYRPDQLNDSRREKAACQVNCHHAYGYSNKIVNLSDEFLQCIKHLNTKDMKRLSTPITILTVVLVFTRTLFSQPDYSRNYVNPNSIPDYPVPYVLPETKDIRSDIDKVFNNLLNTCVLEVVDRNTGKKISPDSELTRNADVDGRLGSYNRWDYPNGVVMNGMKLLYDVTGDSVYFQYNVRLFDFLFDFEPYFRKLVKEKNYRGHAFRRMIEIRALDHCGAIGSALIRTYEKHNDPRYKGYIDTIAGYITKKQFRLKDGTIARERPQPESVWADDMYMCIPFLAQMGKYSGNKMYWDDAVRQVIQLSGYLFAEEKGLFDHGWNTYGGAYDPRFYWGRANGWASMAMAELLDVLPENYPGRDNVLHIFRTHIRALAEIQDGTGFWHNMLDKTDTYLETSATAMFVYSIAKGINEGWISHIYGPVAQTGWNAISSRINRIGQIEGVCEGTTYANDNTYYYHRGKSTAATLGTGAVLLAGAEMIRLLQNNKLEIIEAQPDAVNSTFHYRLKGDRPMR
jgi:unsaturated rhamnogalacturonyl hydrolase